MTLEESLSYIHGLYRKGTKPSLNRVSALLKALGDPHKQLKFVHIAGTNGKGSTAAMTASVLQAAGYRAGLFTSPYIYRFYERIQLCGNQIDDADVVALTEELKAIADTMDERPTEFDFVTAMAMTYYARQKADIVVLEVGVGGALDSTNVIPVPEVAVLTNIGLDHTDFLGNTLEEIATTKAGIFKEGGDAVLYPGEPAVESVVETICKERNMRLKKADFSALRPISHDLFGQVFDHGERKGLELPLLGGHQLHNAAVVLAILDTLKEKGWNITEENIRAGLRDVSWPGRFDIVRRDPLFIIDGGHNPQCFDALTKNMTEYLSGRKIIALTGVLADKDYITMYKPVLPYIREFVCITPPTPRKLEAVALAQHLQAAGATATPCDTIAEGVGLAIEKAGTEGVVLCFGSLYSIADIKAGLDNL